MKLRPTEYPNNLTDISLPYYASVGATCTLERHGYWEN